MDDATAVPDEPQPAADDMADEWTPPTHVGVLHRRAYNPEQGVLRYQRLGGSRTYRLVYDGCYHQYAVRREQSSSAVGGFASKKTDIVYPEDGSVIDVDGPKTAAKEMVEYLREQVITVTVPESLNGWQKAPDTAAIVYRTPYNTAKLSISVRGDRYDAVLHREQDNEPTVLTASVPERTPAIATLKSYMAETDPLNHGLPDAMSLGVEYGGFKRTPAQLGELARVEHPAGYRVTVVEEDGRGDERTYTVRTSLGDQMQGLPACRVDRWVERFAGELESRHRR